VPRVVHAFDPPERFVAGTVGMPGERTFYLQAVAGPRVVSVALEKQQVVLLGDKLTELLDEARRRGGDVPVGARSEDSGPLTAPVEEEFRVAALGLAWDASRARVVIEAVAPAAAGGRPAEPLADDAEGPDVVRVVLTPAQARAFVSRARRVIAAGRAPCWLCGQPLDPQGHRCPRLS